MPHRKQAMRWCSLIGASCGDASEAERLGASDTAQERRLQLRRISGLVRY
jgi:hypothetical protein